MKKIRASNKRKSITWTLAPDVLRMVKDKARELGIPESRVAEGWIRSAAGAP